METHKYYQQISVDYRKEMLLLADFFIPRFTVAYVIMDLLHMIGLNP